MVNKNTVQKTIVTFGKVSQVTLGIVEQRKSEAHRPNWNRHGGKN